MFKIRELSPQEVDAISNANLTPGSNYDHAPYDEAVASMTVGLTAAIDVDSAKDVSLVKRRLNASARALGLNLNFFRVRRDNPTSVSFVVEQFDKEAFDTKREERQKRAKEVSESKKRGDWTPSVPTAAD